MGKLWQTNKAGAGAQTEPGAEPAPRFTLGQLVNPLKHAYPGNLSKGSADWREVTRVQVWLKELGDYNGKIDGGFGDNTWVIQ